MEIILKDGSKKTVEAGKTCLDVTREISEGLARNAVAVKINGKVYDMSAPVSEGEFTVVTLDTDDGRRVLRHTASHVMAQAVKRLYPNAKLAIGPAIDDGFYYDFDVEKPFTPEDLQAIENEMKKIVKEGYKMERFELPRAEALKLMQEKGEPYKVELINDLPEDAVISFYRQGDFTDLCAGPHMPSVDKVKAFKLLSATGAYWRGNSDNKMLCRIYGTAFEKKSELDEYVTMLEEAKKRDHRKLGRELDLFDIFEEGPGFPFFFPKGMVLRNILEDFWREEHRKNGYVEIKTPMILSEELWHRSGHWDHYKDNMYTTKIDGADYAIKPMNCPGGMLAFKRKIHSYRDLPERVAELGLVHRHELSGALHGLMRVRCFTQDDAHIFMTEDQIESEILGVMKMIDRFYSIFGFKYMIELSTRPENSMGTDEQWELATNALKAALDKNGIAYKINEGDGAFYGPKIDFHLKDSIGRTWQCGTIQLDFQMPERFDVSYIGEDNEKHRPVMIHRVIFGSIERFIGIITEHFAGAFPVWLAPVQAIVLPISEKHMDYAKSVEEKLKASGVRVELDSRNEKIGYKIREAQLQKIPYMLVVGDSEANEGTLSVRDRAGENTVMSIDDFAAKVADDVKTKRM